MHGSHGIGTCRIGTCGFGNSKVRYLHFSFVGNNNILRLNVTMNDVTFMYRFHSGTYLQRDADHLFWRQLLFFRNIFFQRDPLDQLHYHIVKPPVHAYIIDIDNIRIHNSGCGLCLGPELLYICFIFPVFFFQYFYGNVTIQHIVASFVNIGHPAGADLTEDLIPLP